MPSPPGRSDPPPLGPDAPDRQINDGVRGVDNRGTNIVQQINVVGGTARFILELPRPAKLGIAFGGVALFVLGVFVLSAGARQAACEVPGIRSLCDGPTMAEEVQWRRALTQEGGDGLRRYLQLHPAGSYAEEAQARLDGCVTERVETMGPERDVRYMLRINPRRLHPLPTKAAARKDALDRGQKDVDRECGRHDKPRFERLSARIEIEREDWQCLVVEGGFACGFDGEIVCRVRDLGSYQERCSDPGQ